MNNDIIKIMNHIEYLNIEETLKYLFECSFIYESDLTVFNYIFNYILKYSRINVNEKNILSDLDKKILIKSIYLYKYKNLNSLRGPLNNLLFILSNDDLSNNITLNIAREYIKQLEMLIRNKEKKLELEYR